MSDVLVRDLNKETIDRLKKRASRQKRSLQAEMKLILERAAEQPDPSDALKTARKIRAMIADRGQQQTDSAILLREDRDR